MQQVPGRMPTKRSSLSFLRECGLPIGTIVDIGVQRRTPDLIATFPDHKHILIEPIEENYPFIHRNYAGMDYELLPAAASDRDGQGLIRLRSRAPERGLLMGSLQSGEEEVRSADRFEDRTVREVALDTALPFYKSQRPYLIKLDVDGDELRILAGATQTLKNTSCVVIETPVRRVAERINALDAHGFILWDIIDLNYYKGNLSHFDMVFVPGWQRHLPALNPWSASLVDPKGMESYLHEPS